MDEEQVDPMDPDAPEVTVVYCKWCGWSGKRPRLWRTIRDGNCPRCAMQVTPAGRR